MPPKKASRKGGGRGGRSHHTGRAAAGTASKGPLWDAWNNFVDAAAELTPADPPAPILTEERAARLAAAVEQLQPYLSRADVNLSALLEARPPWGPLALLSVAFSRLDVTRAGLAGDAPDFLERDVAAVVTSSAMSTGCDDPRHLARAAALWHAVLSAQCLHGYARSAADAQRLLAQQPPPPLAVLMRCAFLLTRALDLVHAMFLSVDLLDTAGMHEAEARLWDRLAAALASSRAVDHLACLLAALTPLSRGLPALAAVLGHARYRLACVARHVIMREEWGPSAGEVLGWPCAFVACALGVQVRTHATVPAAVEPGRAGQPVRTAATGTEPLQCACRAPLVAAQVLRVGLDRDHEYGLPASLGGLPLRELSVPGLAELGAPLHAAALAVPRLAERLPGRGPVALALDLAQLARESAAARARARVRLPADAAWHVVGAGLTAAAKVLSAVALRGQAVPRDAAAAEPGGPWYAAPGWYVAAGTRLVEQTRAAFGAHRDGGVGVKPLARVLRRMAELSLPPPQPDGARLPAFPPCRPRTRRQHAHDHLAPLPHHWIGLAPHAPMRPLPHPWPPFLPLPPSAPGRYALPAIDDELHPLMRMALALPLPAWLQDFLGASRVGPYAGSTTEAVSRGEGGWRGRGRGRRPQPCHTGLGRRLQHGRRPRLQSA
jgi:hypothetical protein